MIDVGSDPVEYREWLRLQTGLSSSDFNAYTSRPAFRCDVPFVELLGPP